jgi:hypothetical protein
VRCVLLTFFTCKTFSGASLSVPRDLAAELCAAAWSILHGEALATRALLVMRRCFVTIGSCGEESMRLLIVF